MLQVLQRIEHGREMRAAWIGSKGAGASVKVDLSGLAEALDRCDESLRPAKETKK